MSKKHFEAIAGIIRAEREKLEFIGKSTLDVDILTRKLAEYFETENPNFDNGRFIGAIR